MASTAEKMSKVRFHDDPLRPPGMRFVVQFIDEPDAASALARFVRMVGSERAAGAVVVASTVDLRYWSRQPATTVIRPSWRVYVREGKC